MRWDFIVVGSGYGGLLPAWRLTRAGANVLLVERGSGQTHPAFRQSWDPLYLQSFYDFGYSTDLTATYRGSRILGGGSVMNSMMHQRVPTEAFDYEESDSGGRSRPSWPRGVSRAVLDPFYDEAERLLGVRQLHWDEVPRIGGNFARMLRDGGLSADRARMNLGSGCVRCGFCEAGCSFTDGKITLLSRALPEALATGRLEVLSERTVVRIQKLKGDFRVHSGPSAGGLNQTSDRVDQAPRVIVAAGPLGTVPLLHRSSEGLGLHSSPLGEWMSNNGDVNFVLQIPSHYPDHLGHRSTNNAGIITYAFWKEHRVTMHPGFSPVAVMAGIDVRFERGLPWGLEHKRFVQENALHRLIPVNAMKQIDPDLRMGIDSGGRARIRFVDAARSRFHGLFMLNLAKRWVEPVGGQVLVTGIDSVLDQGGNHILGGARMSDDARSGVTAPTGEVWGVPGLFVTDSSALSSALGINPALTVAANALRIADGIVRSA
jgi:choline dehydrogenase-like flavoprotein